MGMPCGEDKKGKVVHRLQDRSLHGELGSGSAGILRFSIRGYLEVDMPRRCDPASRYIYKVYRDMIAIRRIARCCRLIVIPLLPPPPLHGAVAPLRRARCGSGGRLIMQPTLVYTLFSTPDFLHQAVDASNASNAKCRR